MVDAALCAPLTEPYDLLIASAGGFPLDIDLRQAHKGLENACRALKQNGSILFFAECPNVAGHPRFLDSVNQYGDEFEMERALRERFEVGGHKAWWVVRLGRMFDIHLVTGAPREFVERCHLQYVSPEQWPARWAELVARAGVGARIGAMPHAGHTLPVFQRG